MTKTAARRDIVVATCATCGAPKFEKNPCPACGGRENVTDSMRTLKA